MHPALEKIIHKTGLAQLIDLLTDKLSQGELTTLLLEVYRRNPLDVGWETLDIDCCLPVRPLPSR